MKQLEQELSLLRHDVIEMWKLVISQVENSGIAILTFDKDTAMMVSMREKKVDAYELKIDNFCENIFALYQPVAIDLRFVLAVMKINLNLERIADFAYGITRTLLNNNTLIVDEELIATSQLSEMVQEVVKMLNQGLEAFENEQPKFAAAIFNEDNKVDTINANAPILLAQYVQQFPDRALSCLNLIGVFRKYERIGDHCSNIAEEIFFYVDAKVLKHNQKK